MLIAARLFSEGEAREPLVGGRRRRETDVTTAPVGAGDSGPVYAFKAQRHNNVDRQQSPQLV